MHALACMCVRACVYAHGLFDICLHVSCTCDCTDKYSYITRPCKNIHNTLTVIPLIYIYIWICPQHTHTHECTHAHTFLCMPGRIDVYMDVCTTHTRAYTCMRKNVQLHTLVRLSLLHTLVSLACKQAWKTKYVFLFVSCWVCIYIYIYTHIHIHIHTPSAHIYTPCIYTHRFVYIHNKTRMHEIKT
jgi:hypothetical protein